MSTPARSVVLLADDDKAHAAVVLDHIDALTSSRHAVRLVNPLGQRNIELGLSDADVVVIHWSLVPSWDSYMSPVIRTQVADFDGPKVQFIQDEHRWVDEATTTMRDLGISVVFTVLPPDAAATIYGGRLDGVELVPTLTGFVPDSIIDLDTPPLADRPIDIGYRGREIPFWMGRLTYEKAAIGREVLARAPRYGLRCDIAWREEDRIYGAEWLGFLASCKACLGTPSGASIADFDGSVEREVRSYLAKTPDASFDEVEAAVLEPYEGNITVDAISPRIFEAAATRTAMILFPGSYSGLLREQEHYLRLERDYSNLGEIADTLRDLDHLTELTERAHRDLIRSGKFSYRTFVSEFDATIDRITAGRPTRRPTPRRLGLVDRARTVLRPGSAPRS